MNQDISDNIWIKDIEILFNSERITEFIPTIDMTNNEKLNSLVRLSFYLSIILVLCKNKLSYLVLFFGTLILTYLIYIFNTCENKELFKNSSNINIEKPCNLNYKYRLNKDCVRPTKNNPFMNVLPTDDRKRKPACRLNNKIKKEIDTNFNNNLYKDINDVFNRNNSQRSFYTMPSTQLDNEQERFANWLYKVPETCKEGNGNQCVGNLHTSLRNHHTGT